MAVYNTQYPSTTGVAPSYAAAGTTNTVQTAPHMVLVIRNGTAGAVIATMVVPGSNDYGIANPDPTFSIPAAVAGQAGEVWIPLNKLFEDPNTPGYAAWTVPVATSITAAAVRTV